MPSHLTRTVFRRLIAGQPIAHHGCLRRQACSLAAGPRITHISRPRYPVPVARPQQQRRDFFNLNMFRKPRPEARDPDMTPGLSKMMEYAKMERLRARLPPVEEVAKAFDAFFRSKTALGQPVHDSQAQLAYQSLTYIVAEDQARRDRNVASPVLNSNAISIAANVLGAKLSEETTNAHKLLAELLYAEIRSRRAVGAYSDRKLVSVFGVLAGIMCFTGNSMEARTRLLETLQTPDPRRISLLYIWSAIVCGFAREGNETEMLETYRMMNEYSSTNRICAPLMAVIFFYLARDNPKAAKSWWDTYNSLHHSLGPDPEGVLLYANTLNEILRCCVRTNELEWGRELVRDIMQTNPPKVLWDVVLVWAVGTKKGVDEIDRMLTVMLKSNEQLPKSEWRLPDIATINALVEFAISRDDPYTAERFIALGRQRGIESDAKTFVLQMQYRLSVDDIDGALIAYKHLQAQDLSSNADVTVVNKLIAALCTSQRHDFDTIMGVAADLSDRRARFVPDTVAALALLHFSRDELPDIIDLLNTHAFHYSSADRARLRTHLLAYITAPPTPTPRAWHAYTIFRQIFDESPRPERTLIMQSFLTRRRADMAVHVFSHMRAHSRPDTLPVASTYIAALAGVARCADPDSVDALYNLLALDPATHISTRLTNALMLAYTATARPRRALDFWHDLADSREGPSYNSIHIALRACETSPFGDLQAQRIWARIRRGGVEVDQQLWVSYVGGRAGNGDNGAVIAMVEQAVESGELQVDVQLVAAFFNAAPGQRKQAEVQRWAEERWPEVWKGVLGVGVEVVEHGMRTVQVERGLEP